MVFRGGNSPPFCCNSQGSTSLHQVSILTKGSQHGPAAGWCGQASPAQVLTSRFACHGLYKWRWFCLASAPSPGWVHTDGPRRVPVCLPGRMDRRWTGLLSHQQLPAAICCWVPQKCYLHLCWARPGKSLRIHSHLPHLFSGSFALPAFSTLVHPQVLPSLIATNPFPQSSLLPLLSLCSLCAVIPAANTVK